MAVYLQFLDNTNLLTINDTRDDYVSQPQRLLHLKSQAIM